MTWHSIHPSRKVDVLNPLRIVAFSRAIESGCDVDVRDWAVYVIFDLLVERSGFPYPTIDSKNMYLPRSRLSVALRRIHRVFRQFSRKPSHCSVILITLGRSFMSSCCPHIVPHDFRSLLMPSFLASSSVGLWFLLMILVYFNTPDWFFIPFFIVTTIGYMKMMEAASSWWRSWV